ncbi:MAG: putative formate dehydrogenase [Alphaproteobacteria bacterium MarineAlpha2_Bin1]|nr:MAG: putative formate dehydrogenase [Alphaproteobacteria bacterium MarineAlpha2_Bin1]
MGYYKDLGTPQKKSDTSVSLEIDGKIVNVTEGTSVLRAAAENDIDIPKLCATDSLEPFGSCRLCLVEIDGIKGTPASCTTPVQDGMKIRTQTKKLAKIRKGVMELYISDHPLDCLTCSANGDCELQDMAGAVGLREVRYGFEGKNHLAMNKDDSNPYFSFDPSKCIVCSRCVRACEEQQGTFALTIEGRGFESKVTTGEKEFFDSDCVSCGACVKACPTATLIEKSVVEKGQPTRKVNTTCAYCGVGCSFTAELQGDDVIRMTPNKNGKANLGHSCVKGRFAWGYATHSDRVKSPLIRESINKPWREASWDEAIKYVADKFKDIQNKFGVSSIGGITSSRCTNEETFLVQKLIRTAFGNNNTDTCARVCHSPTGYGLKTTFGTSAGTQDFESVLDSDLIMVIGANPTDAHPVFASLMKRRLRNGAKLIVIDPRKIDLVRTPHVEASNHLQLFPGTNVALINSIAHVIAKEGLLDTKFINERCDKKEFNNWLNFILQEKNSPEEMEVITGVPAIKIIESARLYAKSKNSSIYYGLGVTEHSQGTTMVMGMANLAMATGNLGRKGVGVNPLRGQNNVQGACDMGSFPHEFSGYRHVSDKSARKIFEDYWKVELDPEPGLRIPNMLDAAMDGTFKGIYIQGEDIAQSDPNTNHVISALSSMDCVVVQDLFLNETSKYAHVFLPGSSFLEKDGTFTNAERRISRVTAAMKPLAGLADWEVTMALSNALGYKMHYNHPSEIMDEIAELTPTFSGVSYKLLDQVGSIQWPCNEQAPIGTPIMHVDKFVRGSGLFMITDYIPTNEKTGPRFPLILTTGRVLSQYNVGVQSRRTKNNIWYSEDVLDINPFDAETRGINNGDYVSLQSRKGATKLKARFSNRLQPGVVYTTFHHPETEANVITTEFSDWATNCPEYKVTAVEVRLSNSVEGNKNKNISESPRKLMNFAQ